MAPRSEEGERLEIEFAPNLALVTQVRQFVGAFYGHCLGDPEATSRIAVAAHELLENAVKYASHRQVRIRISLERGEDGAQMVTIETGNHATVEDLRAAREALDELAMGGADSMTSYLKLLDRSAKRTSGSGLGLGRVRAEADMTLSYEIRQDELIVRAQARLEPRVAP
jgi:two-component sensor histidine kinase